MRSGISPKAIGRFAPSPTGPVHIGTLAAAMASYLDIKTLGGDWLLRIDDIDRPREIAGAADRILAFLDKMGFAWDAPVVRQNDCLDIYQDYLKKLQQEGLTYRCLCSRKQLGSGPYPGTCRTRNHPTDSQHAIRLLTNDQIIGFSDRLQGHYQQNLQATCGDFVIFRKDQLFAYQLAVVIDDEIAGVTHITRGEDLLDSTPRQLYLQRLLQFKTPEYAHFPVILDSNGDKFSKSSPDNKPLHADLKSLTKAWNHLQSINVNATDFDTIDNFWRWALSHWRTSAIKEKCHHV